MEYFKVRSFSTRRNNGSVNVSYTMSDGSQGNVDIKTVYSDLREIEETLRGYERSGDVMEDVGEFSASLEMARCFVRNAENLWMKK